MREMVVAKIAVSLSMPISFEKCVFEAAMSTTSPLKNFKRSCKDISFSLQRKSFKKVISVCSTPTHAKLLKDWKKYEIFFCNNFKINFSAIGCPNNQNVSTFSQPCSRTEMIPVENSFFVNYFSAE